MKRLLLLVLLLSAVLLVGMNVGKYSELSEIPSNEIAILYLLELYEEYEQECYADSTWMTIEAYDIMEQYMQHYEITGQDESVYYLRINPTFKGYIEFIKNKLGAE